MSRSRAQRRKAQQQAGALVKRPVAAPPGGVRPAPAMQPPKPVPPAKSGLNPHAFVPPSGELEVPSMTGEVMGHFSRLLVKLRVATGLVLVLGVLTATGWILYVRADRARADAEGRVESALAQVATASRPDLDERIASLQAALTDTEAKLAATTGQREEAERARATAEKARAEAEQNAVAEKQARLAAEAKATVAETGRAAAEAKAAAAETSRSATETSRTATEASLSAADRTRRELEARLASSEQARAAAEARLPEVERARTAAEANAIDLERVRAAAEARAADAERQAAALKEQIARLTEDVQGYRRDLETAREEQRRIRQRLEPAPAAASLNAPSADPVEASGTPAAPPDALSAPPDEAAGPTTRPVSPEPAAVVITPGMLPAPPDPEAAFKLDARSPLDIHVPPATRPGPEALAAASPSSDAPAIAFFNTGEYQLVKGEPALAVELIQRAIRSGGERADFLKSMGWALLRAGRPEEAKTALTTALAGFENWSPPPPTANPDHWVAAYLLGRVDGPAFVQRWKHDAQFGGRLACLPWFYIGQRREMEGRIAEAREAYRTSVELGRVPNAYPIWRWSAQRLSALELPAAQTRPAR